VLCSLSHYCCRNVDCRCRYNAECDLPTWQHPRDASPQRLLLDDPDPYQHSVTAIDGTTTLQQYVTSVRITTARNIAGVRLAPTMTLGDRQRVSSQLKPHCCYCSLSPLRSCGSASCGATVLILYELVFC
jgi:hypothetical protein